MPVQNIGRMLYQRGIDSKDWELYRNYRLPLPVAKYIQYVGVNLPPFIESIYKSKERTMPYVLRYANANEQVSAIKRIKENNDFTDVAILVPSGELVRQIGESLINLGLNVEMKYDDRQDFRNSKNDLNFTSTNPKVMSYHSAKGLQFEAVFLPYIDSFVDDRGDNSKALYVAMSRTYRYLYIMYSGQLPRPLNNIPASLFKTTETEEVEDI
jgi:superfamily I DNA/RNA helicase